MVGKYGCDVLVINLSKINVLVFKLSKGGIVRCKDSNRPFAYSSPIISTIGVVRYEFKHIDQHDNPREKHTHMCE